MNDSNLSFLATLEQVIVDRLQNPVEGSYTSSLAAKGQKHIAQKVGEEAVELALAAVAGNRQETVSEAADLIYHVLVLLNIQDIAFNEVADALEARHAP